MNLNVESIAFEIVKCVEFEIGLSIIRLIYML